MNLTPLYELRSRLKNSMIAGTGLLAEDFRLKRAVEGIRPFAKAAPVFAKISELAEQLFEEERDNKEEILLDAITLLDALLCTQASVSIEKFATEISTAGNSEIGVSTAETSAEETIKESTDEILETTVSDRGNLITEVKNYPYSLVKTLTEALTVSGSGHYAQVLEMHETYPELFEDYRVKLAMTQALGASYYELGDQVEQWLKDTGDDGIARLLMRNFDPKGKREMVRRVHVIEEICGGRANAFYRRELPNAEKEVREALIWALRFEPENLELLLSLEQTEKKSMKKVVLATLANLSPEEASAPFEKIMKKKPESVFDCLHLSQTEWGSRLTAKCLIQGLEQWEQRATERGSYALTKEEANWWETFLPILIGKRGTEIEEAFAYASEWMRAHIDPQIKAEEEQKKKENSYESSQYEMPTNQEVYGMNVGRIQDGAMVKQALGYALMVSLRMGQDEGLCALAEKLYEQNGWEDPRNPYFGSALLAKLFEPGDCSEWIREQIFLPESNLLSKAKALAKFVSQIKRDKSDESDGSDGPKAESKLTGKLCSDRLDALEHVFYGIKPAQSGWKMESKFYYPVLGDIRRVVFSIPQRFEDRMIDLLMDCKALRTDKILANLADLDSQESRQKIGDYFYQRARVSLDVDTCVGVMKRCGCTECKGILSHYIRTFKRGFWDLWYFCDRRLPGTGKAKAQEIRETVRLLENGTLKLRQWNKQYAEQLENLAKHLEEEEIG